MSETILRRPQVLERTGVSTSTLYLWMREGRFPRPVALGTNSVGWRASDVDAWIAALTSATPEAA